MLSSLIVYIAFTLLALACSVIGGGIGGTYRGIEGANRPGSYPGSPGSIGSPVGIAPALSGITGLPGSGGRYPGNSALGVDGLGSPAGRGISGFSISSEDYPGSQAILRSPGAFPGPSGVYQGVPGLSGGLPVYSSGLPAYSGRIPGVSGGAAGFPGGAAGFPGGVSALPGRIPGLSGGLLANQGVPGSYTEVPGGYSAGPGGYISGVGAGIYGIDVTTQVSPKPYSISYQAPDGQGGAQYKTESGDGSGAVSGTYGYFDAQGLYRTVDYVADELGFRATVKTNEPGVDGKENPADVNMLVEKTPAGIQEMYTPSTAAFAPEMTGLSSLGGIGGGSGIGESYYGAPGLSAGNLGGLAMSAREFAGGSPAALGGIPVGAYMPGQGAFQTFSGGPTTGVAGRPGVGTLGGAYGPGAEVLGGAGGDAAGVFRGVGGPGAGVLGGVGGPGAGVYRGAGVSGTGILGGASGSGAGVIGGIGTRGGSSGLFAKIPKKLSGKSAY